MVSCEGNVRRYPGSGMRLILYIVKGAIIMEEMWDLLNDQGKPTGKLHKRGLPMQEGTYHLVVHVWVVNQKGELLLSQRSVDRPTHPLQWEVTGGSVLAGETSFQGALREVREELGISPDPTLGRLILHQRREAECSFCDGWLFYSNVELADLPLPTEEVAAAKWVTMEEFKTLYAGEDVVHAFGYMDQIFDAAREELEIRV